MKKQKLCKEFSSAGTNMKERGKINNHKSFQVFFNLIKV